MYPNQPQAPAPMPGNDYNFILNPEKPPRRGLFGGLGKDPFVAKIVFILGGAAILMTVLAIIVNLFFGGKTNVETLVSLAQTEQEIVRLSAMGEDAIGQDIRNAAINTRLSVRTHQQEWLVVLTKNNRKIEGPELALKKDAATDKKLTTATETSTFDTTYTAIMRSQLTAYAATLQSAYKGASDEQERNLLSDQFDEVQLLLEQWPS